MSKEKHYICKWYVCSHDSLLFIFTSGQVMDYDGNFLVKETYRCRPYFRWKGTSKRISLKTIKSKFERCNATIKL